MNQKQNSISNQIMDKLRKEISNFDGPICQKKEKQAPKQSAKLLTLNFEEGGKANIHWDEADK